jgi:excisionase family DNA binding protein
MARGYIRYCADVKQELASDSRKAEIRRGKKMTRHLFTFAEVAERWGISHFTIRRAVERGELKTVYIGSRRLLPISEVLRAEQYGLGAKRLEPQEAEAVEAR